MVGSTFRTPALSVPPNPTYCYQI